MLAAGTDGRMLSQTGQQVRFELRSSSGQDVELAALANDWRRLGIDVTEKLMSRAESRDNEFIAKFPGLEITQQAKNDSVLRRVDVAGAEGPGTYSRSAHLWERG